MALAAVGRVLASILETLFVVGVLYAAVALTVGVDIDWRLVGLLPAGFLLVGAVGGLASAWWRSAQSCSTEPPR